MISLEGIWFVRQQTLLSKQTPCDGWKSLIMCEGGLIDRSVGQRGAQAA